MNTANRKPARRARAGVGTGTTSLLMIFTVLCFATLAMLSLSTALSNQRIQQRGLERTQSLAAARGAAAQKVAELDAGLMELAERDAAYEDKALALAAAEGWEADAENRTVTLRTPVDAENELLTQLEILPAGGATRYELVQQVAVLTGGWTPEDAETVWQGNG